MRRIAQSLAALLVACAGAPPPAPQTPEKVAVVEAQPEPEKPRPPEPLATEAVELTQSSEFIALGLGSIQPKLWTDDELLQRLPAAAKLEFQAVERARAAARTSRAKESQAALELIGCDGCKSKAALEIKHKLALRAAENAEDAQGRTKARAEKSLERQLNSPKAAPEVGIALARIASRGFELSAENDSSHLVEYAEEKLSSPGADALERALPLAGADQVPGQRVRQELLSRLWSKRDAARARQLIDELLTSGPREWRAELRFRAALFDALDGDDAKAAEAFERGLEEHVAGSVVTRETLATGVLFARYRALDFERALAAAMRVFEEADRPIPPADPPPAPVAKPSPTKKRPKGLPAAAARKTALRDAVEFGMLGLLSTTSASTPSRERAAERFAADAVERLGRDPTSIEGPARAKAAIVSLLAVRSLYRNDVVRARRLAESARSLGALAETRDAIDVLRALALRDDDMARAKGLQEEMSKLPWRSAFGQQVEPDARDLQATLRDTRSDRPKLQRRNDKPAEPAVAHNVRSALRACVEPVRTRLPAATGTGNDRRIATLTLNARVFADGRAELDVHADRKEDGIAQLVECLKGLGPRVLAHAPSSVSAAIVLDESVRSGDTWLSRSGLGGLGGLLGGGEIGQAFGSGGLGVRGVGRGGGGTGDGTGIGGLGVRGVGGTGTGRGYGALRTAKEKQLKNPVGPRPKPPTK